MKATQRSYLELANMAERDPFVALLGGVFESSPWVASCAFAHRPFSNVDELHRAMMRCVGDAKTEQQLNLIRAHPELAGREAIEGSMTSESASEQERLGFTALTRAEIEEISQINRIYRQKFGFPCIVALRLHDARKTVVAEMTQRIRNDAATEFKIALQQIGHITRGRLGRIMGEC